MKNNIGKYIGIVLGIICIILTITLICIKVSSVSAKTDEKDLKQKVKDEISYFESNIIEVMNKLNNIEVIKYKVYTKEVNDPKSENNQKSDASSSSSKQSSGQDSSQGGGSSGGESSSSQGGQSSGGGSSESSQSNTTTVSELVPNTTLEENSQEPDWTNISFLVENIYSSWPTANLDFQKQGIAQENITSFSLSMDGVIQSVKNKDKNNALVNLFNMYINIPKYLASINADNFTLNICNTKLNILNAYVLAVTGDRWNDITTCVTNAKSYFSSIISADESDEKRKTALQKAYVIIEDLERMSGLNDKEIFFMSYKNVMQELETL